MSFAAAKAGGADTARVAILVVGEAASAAPVAAILEAADREVVVVASGEDALRVLAAQAVAVCVLSAPGAGAAAVIGAEPGAGDVPVVLVAGKPLGAADLERAYASGVVDVIPHPVDAVLLRAKVAAFVTLHHRRVREVARREAEHAGLQARFLATLGEELRPPLNAIVGWVRMLRDGSIRESQRVRALETVERSAQAQLELIEEMLDVSRMTSRALTLDLVAVDPRQIVEDVVEVQRAAAVEKQLTLFAAVDEDVGPMFADAERLRQIVHRLVRHAVMSTPTEGVVTVSLRNTDTRVELAITDLGGTGGAAVAPGVFDGFAIVRHLVELHDGTIAIEDAAPGGGRRFVVNLPAAGRPPRTDDEVR